MRHRPAAAAAGASRPHDGLGTGSVDLYWLPLGAGGWFVRLNGLVFEALAAALARRERGDLYHSALEVRAPEGRYVIEMAPVWSSGEPGRGVVAEGAVGARVLGRSRLFRYEVRRWRDGVIPDVAEAVESAEAERRRRVRPACARARSGHPDARLGP